MTRLPLLSSSSWPPPSRPTRRPSPTSSSARSCRPTRSPSKSATTSGRRSPAWNRRAPTRARSRPPPTGRRSPSASARRRSRRSVFRGEAAKWRDAKTQVEWLDTIAGGRLPDQEAPLRDPARLLDPRPALRAGQTRRQSPGQPRRQRARRQRQGGRLQADPLHQHGQARDDRAQRRVARHGPAPRGGLPARAS